MWLVSDFISLGLIAQSLRRLSPLHFSLLPFTSAKGKLSLPSADVGIELSSRAVSREVLSPLQSLTSVFGMGTGGPSAFVTPTSFLFKNS